MCCLKYEQEAYEHLLRVTPKHGAIVETKDGKGMEEQKLKRVRNAGIVGAILLIVILLSVLIFQLVKIGNEKRELSELQDAIKNYQQLTDEERTSTENMNTREWIEQRARELGLKLEGDFALD
jgi:cell division protein FtsL